MKHKKLKSGFYTSPQKSNQFEFYIIENEVDLQKFAESFKETPLIKTMVKNIKESLNNGEIVIATDIHPMSGCPTYCFETKDPNCEHPSSFHRVK
jgi:hypothetical protein